MLLLDGFYLGVGPKARNATFVWIVLGLSVFSGEYGQMPDMPCFFCFCTEGGGGKCSQLLAKQKQVLFFWSSSSFGGWWGVGGGKGGDDILCMCL